jgi:hypothetical protein
MNGYQAALHVPSAIVDVVGASGGLYLRAAMNKTYTGVTLHDFPLKDVLSVLAARLLVDVSYGTAPITAKNEVLLMTIIWISYRRLALKETWTETFELLFMMALSIWAIASIVVKI